MRSRLIKTLGISYELTAFDGENRSGTKPLNDFVLIIPDKLRDTIGKAQKLVMPDELKDNVQLATETGVIVAVGAGAFRWGRDRMREWEGDKPAPGDRVFYQRYAGQTVTGIDGLDYRCMSDKEIALVQIAEAPAIATGRAVRAAGLTKSGTITAD